MEIQTIKQAVVKFIKDEEGLTVVEYAVAGGLIALSVVAAFKALGLEVGRTVDDICKAINGGAACPAT